MKPPADRQLNLDGTGTDVPAAAPLRYGVHWSIVFMAATVLALFSTLLAWQFTVSLGHEVRYWRTLIILNTTYWYLWALFTPAIIWLSQHFRFERKGLWRAVVVHLPSVVMFSLTHILTMSGVQWWFARAQGRPFAWWEEAQKSALLNFDWEMMTYWTIVGLSHAVLYYRESKDRALRTSQLETRLVEAQLKTLQQQLHPHFLFNTLHAISALMHRDVEAADRTLMRLSDLLRLTLEHIGQQEIPLQTELDFLSTYLRSKRRASPIGWSSASTCRPRRSTRSFPTSSCSRSSKTQSSTASRKRPGRGTSISRRGARATSFEWKSATTAKGCRRTP